MRYYIDLAISIFFSFKNKFHPFFLRIFLCFLRIRILTIIPIFFTQGQSIHEPRFQTLISRLLQDDYALRAPTSTLMISIIFSYFSFALDFFFFLLAIFFFIIIMLFFIFIIILSLVSFIAILH